MSGHRKWTDIKEHRRMNRYGQIAYEAYANSREWRTWTGEEMTPWGFLGGVIQTAWAESAQATIKAYETEGSEPSE